MPATLKEVKSLIERELPGSDVAEIEEFGGRVFGTIRWDGFEQMNSEERNKYVATTVRDKLGLRGLNVGILFPRVPGEEE